MTECLAENDRMFIGPDSEYNHDCLESALVRPVQEQLNHGFWQREAGAQVRSLNGS